MVAGIKADVKDIGDDTKEINDWLKILCNQFSYSKIIKVSAMNYTMDKFMSESYPNQTNYPNKTKIDNIFQATPLRFADYEQDNNEDPRKGGRVTKWYRITNKSEKFAFSINSKEGDENLLQSQITILKELHDWQNIIKFYGLVYDGKKSYFVTEWAEYGNLSEFYKNHKDRFDLRLKLRISLDIARGLNFLRTVEVIMISF
jgi:serine/threonine protein kinase